jgi:hypothetical protein
VLSRHRCYPRVYSSSGVDEKKKKKKKERKKEKKYIAGLVMSRSRCCFAQMPSRDILWQHKDISPYLFRVSTQFPQLRIDKLPDFYSTLCIYCPYSTHCSYAACIKSQLNGGCPHPKHIKAVTVGGNPKLESLIETHKKLFKC